MVCKIILECPRCKAVVFSNSMFPEDVPSELPCPGCGAPAEVVEKELVLFPVDTYIENMPPSMIDKEIPVYGAEEESKPKGRKRKSSTED